MLAAGELIPKLVCSLADDEQAGKQLLDVLVSGLVAARAPPDLRRGFTAQAIEASQQSEAVAFYRRCVEDEAEDEGEFEVGRMDSQADVVPTREDDDSQQPERQFSDGIAVGPIHQAAICPIGHATWPPLTGGATLAQRKKQMDTPQAD